MATTPPTQTDPAMTCTLLATAWSGRNPFETVWPSNQNEITASAHPTKAHADERSGAHLRTGSIRVRRRPVVRSGSLEDD